MYASVSNRLRAESGIVVRTILWMCNLAGYSSILDSDRSAVPLDFWYLVRIVSATRSSSAALTKDFLGIAKKSRVPLKSFNYRWWQTPVEVVLQNNDSLNVLQFLRLHQLPRLTMKRLQPTRLAFSILFRVLHQHHKFIEGRTLHGKGSLGRQCDCPCPINTWHKAFEQFPGFAPIFGLRVYLNLKSRQHF